jgi:hypothetical protein
MPIAESILQSDSLIKGTVMFDTAQFQNGVLIEPEKPVDPRDSVAVTAFLDAIWLINFLIAIGEVTG